MGEESDEAGTSSKGHFLSFQVSRWLASFHETFGYRPAIGVQRFGQQSFGRGVRQGNVVGEAVRCFWQGSFF